MPVNILEDFGHVDPTSNYGTSATNFARDIGSFDLETGNIGALMAELEDIGLGDRVGKEQAHQEWYTRKWRHSPTEAFTLFGSGGMIDQDSDLFAEISDHWQTEFGDQDYDIYDPIWEKMPEGVDPNVSITGDMTDYSGVYDDLGYQYGVGYFSEAFENFNTLNVGDSPTGDIFNYNAGSDFDFVVRVMNELDDTSYVSEIADDLGIVIGGNGIMDLSTDHKNQIMREIANDMIMSQGSHGGGMTDEAQYGLGRHAIASGAFLDFDWAGELERFSDPNSGLAMLFDPSNYASNFREDAIGRLHSNTLAAKWLEDYHTLIPGYNQFPENVAEKKLSMGLTGLSYQNPLQESSEVAYKSGFAGSYFDDPTVSGEIDDLYAASQALYGDYEGTRMGLHEDYKSDFYNQMVNLVKQEAFHGDEKWSPHGWNDVPNWGLGSTDYDDNQYSSHISFEDAGWQWQGPTYDSLDQFLQDWEINEATGQFVLANNDFSGLLGG